jgi:HEPN domain-containing protein
LNRARSSLAKAKAAGDIPEVYLEDLCFDTQQAAEKAIKAVLIHLDVQFPYVHDLARLLTLVEESGQEIPDSVKQAAVLSNYAVAIRYPGLSEPVAREEFLTAIKIAENVIGWAENVIKPESGVSGES